MTVILNILGVIGILALIGVAFICSLGCGEDIANMFERRK